MKEKDKIYGHIETVPDEIPEEIKNLPQSEKWLCAMCQAPEWKKDEYMAQFIVWDASEIELKKMLCPDWCNPLSRA